MSTSISLATSASDAAGPLSVSHVCTKPAWVDSLNLGRLLSAWWSSSCHMTLQQLSSTGLIDSLVTGNCTMPINGR